MDSMMLFDAYELRARLAPALVVASPLVLASVALLQALASTVFATSAATLVFLVLLYGFSFVVRGLGRRIEHGLWESWGGPPSATVLSEGDATFTAETKSQLRACVAATLGIKAATDPEWAGDVSRVQEAFRLVRHRIRQLDPNGLWFVHNAEYGFLRNLLGSWWLLLANALLAAGAGTVTWQMHGGKSPLIVAVLGLALALAAIAGRVLVLPGATRTAAVRYAESAWTSFLASAQGAEHTG